MTKLEKLRDELAEKFYEIRDKLFNVNHFDRETIAVESYKAGWDARDAFAKDELAKLKERESMLVEALEVISERDQFYIKDKDYYAEMNCLKLLAEEALADYKRMMEGE